MDILKIQRRYCELEPLFIRTADLFFMSNSLCYTPDSFGSCKNVSETLFSSTCGLCWVSGPFRCGRLWKCLFSSLNWSCTHFQGLSHPPTSTTISRGLHRHPFVDPSFGWCFCVQISNFTGYDQICASCFELVSNREAKVQKSGFSSCHLWVGLACREVKMILAWNSKFKPFSSCFDSDAKLPKSF